MFSFFLTLIPLLTLVKKIKASMYDTSVVNLESWFKHYFIKKLKYFHIHIKNNF
jgi:hypothetical protein